MLEAAKERRASMRELYRCEAVSMACRGRGEMLGDARASDLESARARYQRAERRLAEVLEQVRRAAL